LIQRVNSKIMPNILPLPELYFFIAHRPDTAVVANHIAELKPS
jgi:hypothetical protein